MDGSKCLQISYILNRMDEKTQRYMLRIEKIMLTPKKGGNQYRPSKSPINCKPNNLDKYLKYQLSSTIILNIISHYNQQFISQFYNAIRTSQYRQKERIYKFVPVETNKKQQHVDLAISGKILSSTLKTIMRRKFIEFANCLQEVAKLSPPIDPSKNRMQRKRSEREPQSYAVLVRTSTKPLIQNYRIVDQWIDGSSNRDYKQSKSSQKIRPLAVKSILKTLSSKVKLYKLTALYQIQYSPPSLAPIKMKHPTQQTPISQPSKSIVKQLPKSQIISPKQSQRIYKSARSIYILINLIKQKLSSVLTTLKTKTQLRQIRTQQNFMHFYQSIEYLCLDFKMKNFHLFFQHLSPPSQIEDSSSRMSDQLSSNMGSEVLAKNNTKQAIKGEEPQSLKINFDSFVDKILNFVAVVSKMLIPLKDAFAKIDNYASFSYRLQQSLKIAPRRYLLDSFNLIKHYTPQEVLPNIFEKTKQKIEQFNELVMPIILQRLIQGFMQLCRQFSHIKIVRRQSALKINLTPVKDSIIEDTIKFIRAREEHSSHSFQSWNELKSIIMSPPPSELRGQGKILI